MENEINEILESLNSGGYEDVAQGSLDLEPFCGDHGSDLYFDVGGAAIAHFFLNYGEWELGDVIENRTPHPIHVKKNEGEITFQKSEAPIRLASKTIEICEILGIPTSKTTMSGSSLPEFKEGLYYIVSLVVQLSFPDREDLLIPNEVVRDESGRIIGCKSLGRS